tara:strand:- start:726 stop:1112 length:387 start_codon:yes stop_codon:yes gene_type:complete
MPFFVPIAIGAATLATGAVVYYGKDALDNVEEITEETAKELLDKGVPFVEGLGDDIAGTVGVLGSASLEFVEGLGTAVFKGAERTYDYLRGKLRGKEPDVIAGFTSAALVILAVVYVYQSAKSAQDAF